jgi:hypothetical protein
MHTGPKPKIRIEFTDQQGSAYTLSIDGPARDNITKVLDFVDSLSASSPSSPNPDTVDTNFARVYGIVQSRFRFASFTSVDLLEAYQDEIGIPTTLSTMSTYLSRLWTRGYLQRARTGSGWSYRLIRADPEALDKATIQR